MPQPYVRPVQGKVVRADQGLDIQGKPGDPVVAIGLARVDAVKDDPGGFGKAVYYTLLDGPQRGRQIYVGHAQPTVTAGQMVQAGDSVATLLEHGLGNAANLSGWAEVGFAKDGAPDPSAPGTKFAGFYKSLGAAVPQQAPAPATQPQAAPQTVDTSQDTTSLVPGGPPDPTVTQPQVLPPGYGGVQDVSAALWRQVTSQPGVSQDTLAYAQNAFTATGG